MGTFDVEPEVGTIFVAQHLDYEMEQRYELRLVASDGKWENESLVVVQVVNHNDEAPVFGQTEYHAAVTEELTELPVFVLEVSCHTYDRPGFPNWRLMGRILTTGGFIWFPKFSGNQLQIILILELCSQVFGHILERHPYSNVSKG